MSDELSYVFDEENHESVHKTTVSKLFAPKLRQTKLALQKSRENLRTLKMYNAHKDSTASQLARKEEIIKLQEKLRSKSIAIRELENVYLTWEEMIGSLIPCASNAAATSFSEKWKRNGDDLWMFVYETIINQVPTWNIPILTMWTQTIASSKTPHTS